ncbi:MAG: diadenylate cyclase [Mariprofundaceae bacterium]|nr:diadenylate cyclase [Mariprofundaceae bacterium]
MGEWQFGIRDAVDIALVAVVIYYVLRLIRGTRAEQMLIGVAVVLAVYELARMFDLLTIEWIFSQFFSVFIVIMVVLFQHEIRRGLMRVAVNPLASGATPKDALIDMLVESVLSLVHRDWGGLIVIERETGLKHLYESGVEMDVALRPDIVQAIFCPDAPMHDGAVIVRAGDQGGRIVAARVLLPLAQASALAGGFGTRHRAAVGLTEESDALVLVVSEERGDLHLAEEGSLVGPLGSAELRRLLVERLSLSPSRKQHDSLPEMEGK